jgi:TP901 family phage tail tape measure protein
MASKKSSVISVLITGDSKQLSGAVDEANSRLGKLGSAIGLAAKAVAAGAAAIGAIAVREFAKFDAAMQKSVAIMGEVSDALRDDMAKAAREVAKTTTFSAEQAAESYFFLASAGLDASASIAAMPKVAAFAQAGMFDMARATDLLTDAQSALGMVIRDDAVANMEQMVRLSDVLVKANTLANASVEQFSTALTTKAGAALRALNKDMEEGVAVLAAFADQGIKGEAAGTQFSIVLRDLTTKALQNEDAFKKFNVRVFDADGNMRNMADIVGDLEGALDGMSDATAKATLLQMGFSDKSLGALMALMGTSEQIREYEKALRDAAGTTDDIANKQLQTFSAQMDLLKSLFADVAIEIGSALVPALGRIVEWIQSKGPQIAAFAEEAGEKIATFIGTVGEKAQEFKTFFDERIKQPARDARDAIVNFADRAGARLSVMKDTFEPFLMAFVRFFQDLRYLIQRPEQMGEEFANAIGNLIRIGMFQIKALKGEITGAFKELIGDLDWFGIGRSAVTGLIQFGLGFAAAFLAFEWFAPVLKTIRENLGVILLAAISVALAPAAVVGRIAAILAKIPLLGRLLAWALTALNRMGAGMRDRIALVFQSFGQAFSNVISRLGPGIISRFVTFIRGIPQALTRMFDDLAINTGLGFSRFGTAVGNAIVRLVTRFRELLSLLFTPFRAFGKTLGDDLFNIGRNLIDALIKGIGSMAGVLAKAVRNIGKSVFDTLSKLWKISSPSKVFMGIGEDAMQGLALGLAGSERMLRDLATGVGDSALPSIDVSGARGMGGQTVVNVTVTSADPQAVVEAIRRYTRANGPLGQVVNV